MIVEQEQRVVARRLEVPVVGAAFLRPMHRALAGIHVEHDAVGVVEPIGLSNQVAVHGHQPDEVVLARQQLRLELMQRRRQRRIRSHRFGDPIKRNVGSVERRCASLRSS